MSRFVARGTRRGVHSLAVQDGARKLALSVDRDRAAGERCVFLTLTVDGDPDGLQVISIPLTRAEAEDLGRALRYLEP